MSNLPNGQKTQGSKEELVFNEDGQFNVYSSAFKYFKITMITSAILWFLLSLIFFKYSAKFAYFAGILCILFGPVAASLNNKYVVSQHYTVLPKHKKKLIKFISISCSVAAGLGLVALPIGLVNWIILSF